MSKNKGYTNAPADVAMEIEKSVPVSDFLPSPAAITGMLKKDPTIPITMNLKKKTVESYRPYARRYGIKYQSFISTLLDTYAKTI
jgi:hypothetical protein